MSFLSSTHQNRLFALALISAVSLFSGCGGSSSSTADNNLPSNDTTTPPTTLEKSDLMISLTDAEGDFVSYLVDVGNITMTHTDGSEVSVLPETTQVDFAQYVDTSELISIASIPYGTYESASITLDFSNAQILVQAEDGSQVLAEPVDESGVALTTLTVELAINDSNNFTVGRGLLPHITLDFDLDASNSIAWQGNVPVVTVTPVLSADTLQNSPKQLRMRGLLGEVYSEQNSFGIHVQPFYKRRGIYGDATVVVDANTQFEIDGEVIVADQGLSALAALSSDTPVVTLGQWNRTTLAYQATMVYAGSSVPWVGRDFISGVVVARQDNTVTVRGALVEHAAGHVSFNDTLSFTISDTTTVNRLGEPSTIAEISVGSAIKVSGILIDDSTLDASEGLVRIKSTQVSGTVVQLNPLVVDIQLLNRRLPDIFDFTGTGQDTAVDADPDYYEIDTGLLNTDNLAVGDLIKISGIVNSFAAGPSDFLANAIVDASEVQGHLVVDFDRSGSLTAFDSISSQGLSINFDEAEQKHYLYRAGTRLDLQTLEMAPLISPAEAGGLFSVAARRQASMFINFESFVAYLEQQLQSGKAITRIDAQGVYDDENNQFNSLHLRVTLAH